MILLMRQTYHRLTRRGRVTHICVSKLTSIASSNGLSPRRRQAFIWTNAGILSIGTLETNLSEILIEIITVSFTRRRLKVSSAIRRPFCLGLNVLTWSWRSITSGSWCSSGTSICHPLCRPNQVRFMDKGKFATISITFHRARGE